PIRLQIDGAASGRCQVYTMTNGQHEVLETPVIGGNYILALSGGASTFQLANTAAVSAGLGFVQKSENLLIPTGGSAISKPEGKMWQVGKVYAVTYTDGVDGEEVFADQTTSGLAGGEATPVFSGTPIRAGYTFTGWSPAVAATVTAHVTYTAQWSRNSSGGGDTTDYYTLTYASNGGTKFPSQTYAEGTRVHLDKLPVREGYTFTGWYGDKELTQKLTEVRMDRSKTVYAGWQAGTVPDMLNGKDHFAYVVGYTDGTVRPLEDISRAEVATIFFRLLKEEVRSENLTKTNRFADIQPEAWHNTPISTMAALGVVKGRGETVFDPDASITRAEFATICARFDTGVTQGSSNFTDVAGHWAQAEIERAAALGWIQGYTDGSFRPDAPITRAEAMTLINRVLCRIPESESDLLKDMTIWPDNQPGVWYYLAVQEATNGHDYRYKGEIYEEWVKLIPAPDWSKYEG
ncbi:MAG: S-layer homology domain-containing protein, partial [Oscillospiraceae bacterium]